MAATWLALLASTSVGCGSRTSLDWVLASPLPDAALDTFQPPELDSGGPVSDGGRARPDARDASAPPSCNAPPWVLFALYSDGPDQGPLSFQVYAIHPDGTGGHPVALPHPNSVYPSVSPDGASIVYAASTLDALYLYRFGEASDVKLATMGTTGFGSQSPDGMSVVYGDGNDLWLVPANGEGASTILISGGTVPGGAAGYPVFTEDSQTVVFGVSNGVESIRVDSQETQMLVGSAGSGGFGNPALSPDYQSLAVVVSCDSIDYGLRTYPYASLPAACESGVLVTPVNLGAAENDPAWGPTGLIAYSDGLNVIVVTVSGGTATNLTANMTGGSEIATEPTWASGCTKL